MGPFMAGRYTIDMNTKKRILIVDDDPHFLELSRYLFPGHETRMASSVYEAYSLLMEETPDMIILDLMMPQKSGLDFLNSDIRKKTCADIPIVIITAAYLSMEKRNLLESDQNVVNVFDKLEVVGFGGSPVRDVISSYLN